MKHLTAKAADVLDLAIEFATLGEYGLEHPEPAVSTAHRSCQRSPDDCRLGRPAVATAKPHRSAGCPNRRTDRPRSEPLDFATALRPPRIRLDPEV